MAEPELRNAPLPRQPESGWLTGDRAREARARQSPTNPKPGGTWMEMLTQGVADALASNARDQRTGAATIRGQAPPADPLADRRDASGARGVAEASVTDPWLGMAGKIARAGGLAAPLAGAAGAVYYTGANKRRPIKIDPTKPEAVEHQIRTGPGGASEHDFTFGAPTVGKDPALAALGDLSLTTTPGQPAQMNRLQLDPHVGLTDREAVSFRTLVQAITNALSGTDARWKGGLPPTPREMAAPPLPRGEGTRPFGPTTGPGGPQTAPAAAPPPPTGPPALGADEGTFTAGAMNAAQWDRVLKTEWGVADQAERRAMIELLRAKGSVGDAASPVKRSRMPKAKPRPEAPPGVSAEGVE